MSANSSTATGSSQRNGSGARARIKNRRKRRVAKAIAGVVLGGIVAGPVGAVAGAAVGITVRRGPVRRRCTATVQPQSGMANQ